jgi:hypothetical protein
VPNVITPKRLRKFGKLLAAFFALALPVYAGTIQGTFQTPNGTPLKNATLSFQLQQAGLLVGTGSVVPVSNACYTSTDGLVVGIGNPKRRPSSARASVQERFLPAPTMRR